jgi:hypothetical protein
MPLVFVTSVGGNAQEAGFAKFGRHPDSGH